MSSSCREAIRSWPYQCKQFPALWLVRDGRSVLWTVLTSRDGCHSWHNANFWDGNLIQRSKWDSSMQFALCLSINLPILPGNSGWRARKFILTPMLCSHLNTYNNNYLSSGPPENKPTRILWLCDMVSKCNMEGRGDRGAHRRKLRNNHPQHRQKINRKIRKIIMRIMRAQQK